MKNGDRNPQLECKVIKKNAYKQQKAKFFIKNKKICPIFSLISMKILIFAPQKSII